MLIDKREHVTHVSQAPGQQHQQGVWALPQFAGIDARDESWQQSWEGSGQAGA
jgi:hypothetical protein